MLEALGAGNPTPGVLTEVTRCVADGMPVLVTSRCPTGPTVPLYGAGGGADLAAAGALHAGTVRSAAARILLSAGLAADPGRVLPRITPHLS